jgi:hypothetical protein
MFVLLGAARLVRVHAGRSSAAASSDVVEWLVLAIEHACNGAGVARVATSLCRLHRGGTGPGAGGGGGAGGLGGLESAAQCGHLREGVVAQVVCGWGRKAVISAPTTYFSSDVLTFVADRVISLTVHLSGHASGCAAVDGGQP